MTIVFRTQEFPTEPEGDLILCNGQPGSAVAHWLRAVLSDQDIKTGEPIQEDYGWGFWLDDPTAVWVAVSYAGGDQADPADAPLWYVSVSHETPIFTPRQWFRRQQGRAWVNQVFAVLQDAISHHTGIMIEAIEKRGNHD
jgi:hypothetical protein